jgi:general secretion pathway protein D
VHSFVGFAFSFFLPLGFAAVVEFLAFCHREFAFRDPIPEVNLQGHDGHTLLLGFDDQPIDLAPVQQQFAFPERVVISRPSGLILRNMTVYQPSFTSANLRVGVAQRPLAFTECLNLSAHKDQTSLEVAEQMVVVGSRTILGDNLDAVAQPVFCATFHGFDIIAVASNRPQGTRCYNFTLGLPRLSTAQSCRLLKDDRQRVDSLPHLSSNARLLHDPRESTRCGGCCLRRLAYLSALTFAAIFLAACPRTNQDYDAGRKAETLEDYDTALVNYQRALRIDPSNAEYKLRTVRMRFEAGQFHVEQGEKALKRGDLQLALAEFEKAQAIDPANTAAEQEIKKTMELIGAKSAAETTRINPNPSHDAELLAAPPVLKPISREPINLKMTNDARVVFETIAKLAGLSVIFDPDFASRRITVELPNITLEQALDAVALESKSFWKPLTSSVMFVAPDNPQKRKDVEDEEVRTFYISNTLTPQDLTEVVTGLRQLLDLRRVQQVNAQNAIVIRDTPDKLVLASKIIRDIDRAKPEVLVHVQVLSANRDRLRDLGILPGQSAVLTFNPTCATQPNSTCASTSNPSGSSTTSTPQITLNNLKNLSTADYSVTLPGASATAILTDNKTYIIQDPEVRISDGEKASVKIGQRVPVATGSFQAGVGVGVGGGSGVVNPLVNTQFQYIDVGVNVDVTPRVHPDGEVSLKLVVDISSIAGQSTIGGIQQPVISQRKIDHDIRLKDGEVSVLGGLIERDVNNNLNGLPGLGELPLFRYLFSDNRHQVVDQELLIVLTPHILRFPSITADNLRTLAAGTDSNIRVFREEAELGAPTAALPGQVAPPATLQPNPQTGPNAGPAAQLHFDPSNPTLKTGDRATLGLAVSNVSDLYSIPLLIHYNPAVIAVEEVRDGGFLSGGTQEIAIVQRADAQRGEVVVSATRQPNTPGVNGSGTLLGIVVRAIGPGTSGLQILQVNARDSQQRTIPMVSGMATIQVQ